MSSPLLFQGITSQICQLLLKIQQSAHVLLLVCFPGAYNLIALQSTLLAVVEDWKSPEKNKIIT